MLDRRAIGILIATFILLFAYQNYILPVWYPPKKPTPTPVQPGTNTTVRPEPEPGERPDSPEPDPTKGEPDPGEKEPRETIAADPETGEKGDPEPEPEPEPEVEDEPELPVRNDLVLALPDVRDQKGRPLNKLRAVFTNKGAALIRLELLDVATSAAIKDPLPIVQEIKKGQHALLLSDRDGNIDLDERVYEWESDRLDRPPYEMSFLARYPRRLEVRKAFWLEERTRALRMRLELRNLGGATRELNLQFDAIAGIPAEAPLCKPYDPATAPADKLYTFAFAGQRKQSGAIVVEKRNFDKVRKHEDKKGGPVAFQQFPVPFVGAMNRYFAVALLPGKDATEWTRSAALSTVGNNNVRASLQSAKLELEPKADVAYEFTLYAGPKSAKTLEPYPELQGIFDFGWFDSIANLLLGLLSVFHFLTQYLGKTVGGYGLAIILLTVLVRGLLHPLSKKAQVSMQKMSKLNPEIQKLRERFSEDKQRLNQETMKLYKEHNVNPAGGCLPMFLQLPVFIALYRALQSSVRLRGEPFLWMADLSQPDALLCFGKGFFGLSSLNILPLLMVFLWVYQQKQTPKSDDPQQAQMQKMMMIMPVVFGFLFYGMPSGLVLYFVVSSGLGLVESKVIKKALADKDEQEKKEGPRAKGRIVPKTKKRRDKFGRPK